MDLNGPQPLNKLLEEEELKLVPDAVQQKLSAYIEKFADEYYKARAAASRLGEAEKKAEELETKIQDYQAKFNNFEQNVAELRAQLDAVSAERTQLLESVSNYDAGAAALRKEKIAVIDERDSLLKVVDRQNSEIDRLKQDVTCYQQQLSAAIAAKCEAIARVYEVQSKEDALNLKERRIESEKAMMQNEIQLLSGDLNRNNAELQNLRRDNSMNTMHLEVRLKEKTDEIQILQNQNGQYVKTIEDLKKKIEELNETILQHNMATEKYVDTLKKELTTKEKLVEIYKNTETENISERNELLTGISDLKRMLNEATESYGQLESELIGQKERHAEEINEMKTKIQDLRTEVKHSNDLLSEVREHNLESAICKLAPTAAVASRLIRSDMSLTELYSLYAKTSEELEAQKHETSQLKLQIKSIIEEIDERAPFFEKQSSEYNKLIDEHNLLIQQRDEIIDEKLRLQQQLDNAEFNITHSNKENKKLKQSQTDLSRQVCMLLDEINYLRAGVNPPRNTSTVEPICKSSDVISKELVPFTSIVEMQEQNAKLLALVRTLSEDLEENEQKNNEISVQAHKEKFEKQQKRISELEEVLAQKNTTINTLMAKCERYKEFYFDAQNKLGHTTELDDSMNVEDGINVPLRASTNSIKAETEIKLERRIQSLEQQLQDELKKYNALKETYDYYTNEKRKNDALLQEQFDAMRKEVRELTSNNCKLVNASEFQKEQIELLHKHIATNKQQIATLEDRSKNYEQTIIKHEQTVHMLKNEVMSAHRKQATSESEVHQLRHENRNLKDTATRLQAEKEAFHREQQNQALLLNKLESIKVNLEHSEAEGRLRLEQRLDDTVRELSAQRRHFLEEEDKFRDTVNEFKRQAETAKKLMEEEKHQAEKVQGELAVIREELAAKNNQINELSKKLQNSLTPSQNENPITAANKKAREFELKYEQAKIDIDALTKELEKAREHQDQYYKMSQSAETEIKRLHDMHVAVVTKSETELKQLRNSEAELKTRVTELEAAVLISNVTDQSKFVNQSDQLKLAQEELKNVLEKLTEANATIRSLRAENSSLTESLNAVEIKYANEMVLHSADIQELAKFKAEFVKVNDEFNTLKSGRESLQAAHDELRKANEEYQNRLQKEAEQFEERAANLNQLNSTLHDQIEVLTSKLAALTQTTSNSANISFQSEQMLDSSAMDVSMTEDNNKNSEQLLRIIKFLRKEKELCAAKVDILKTENARLVAEHTILQKKIDELNGCLNQERTKSETDIVSASKHEEVLRKIETLNAITDSNRILREERNNLNKRVVELTERISSVEKELFPLQCSNKEFASKVEELSAENASLRTEAIKWRQRANALVEKSNRNPEEFKRLQGEREHLAKLLTAEKEINKKLGEDNMALKTRLESELPTLNKHIHLLSEDRKKLNEEITTTKQNNVRMSQDIMELKNRLLQKEEELLKSSEELVSKDKQIQDKDTKELQLRKLAKRYKDYYMQAQGGGAETVAEMEKLRSELDEINGTLRGTKEENERLLQENEELKSRSALEDDTTNVLRESKLKIEKLVQELTVARTELVNKESAYAATKASYDETIARLEKDLQDHMNHKDINARLTRDIESLHMRINQLTRQLGSQQSTKPSTSSVGITEKGSISESSPRTANVKPMSGSATVQQSATVTPWRGGETPLASIRPISVQNSRTAAILPTSQQPSAGSASASTSTSASSATATGSSSAVGNTALVPPQQQVHTTGSATLESMASSSPTSSHTDYMPSTSSAAVAVAAIPPMGATSAAESSQEAESVQHPQQNDSQLFVGGAQQVVALVSPRVEGSSSSSTTTSTQNQTVPSVQISQETSNQQPSTSGGSSSSSIVVSSHSRHTPSSSNVTTTQAGCSSIGIKRPRDVEGDSSTNTEECTPEKMAKITKRMRTPIHSGEMSAAIGDSGMDVDQLPTSSQRDQEDDIVVVDSDEDVLADADDGPIDVGDGEQETYEDSYEQDNEMDENEGGDDEHNVPSDAQDNNEVDIDEAPEEQLQRQDESELVEAAAATISTQENNQQSQTISSGSGESNSVNVSQAEATWKQTPSTSTAAARRTESSVEFVSSPQVSNYVFGDQPARLETATDGAPSLEIVVDESAGPSGECTLNILPQKQSEGSDSITTDSSKMADTKESAGTENINEAGEDFVEDPASDAAEESQQLGNETDQNVGTSQSEIPDNQANQIEVAVEENEGADGVSSEGEKQAVEGVEEEGREAEASTSPSENTRSRTLRSTLPTRRGTRIMRGGNRPTPIIWQSDSMPGNNRNHATNIRNQEQMLQSGGNRIFSNRPRGRRTLRRSSPNNYSARFP